MISRTKEQFVGGGRLVALETEVKKVWNKCITVTELPGALFWRVISFISSQWNNFSAFVLQSYLMKTTERCVPFLQMDYTRTFTGFRGEQIEELFDNELGNCGNYDTWCVTNLVLLRRSNTDVFSQLTSRECESIWWNRIRPVRVFRI